MEEPAKAAGAECPKIVSAVLKALRGEDEASEAVQRLRAHVVQCAACTARLARLGRLLPALTGEPERSAQVEDPAATEAAPEAGQAARRKHRRLPTNEAVNLVFGDGSVTLARMIEVSPKGAKIESLERLDLDHRFMLNRGRRSTEVAVRHCSRQGDLYVIGVEYVRNEVRV